MTKPVLVVFAISHYCEKARWALDYLGIEHTVKHIAPGAHRKFAENLGAPVTSLPILVLGDQADAKFVQGSSAIISWAEANKPDGTPSLTPATNQQEAMDIEQRLDDVMGVHVRRYYYSEALVDYPQTVRPVFTKDLPLFQKWFVSAAWGTIRKLMIQSMDLGHEQGLQSRRLVETELDWLDSMLVDGRSFYSGDSFSRTDIAAASLLAPLILPEQHPTYSNMELSPKVAASCKEWEERRCLQLTREIYQNYR